MNAFRALVSAIKNLPNAANSSNLKSQLNKTVNAMRRLKAAKAANPNAAKLAAANVPATPTTEKSFITRAVNKLTAWRTRPTPTSVRVEANKVVNAISVANRWRRKYPAYRPLGAAGRAAAAAVGAAGGVKTAFGSLGAAYNERRAKLGLPTNVNYKKTLNRFKMARGTPNKPYILLANELAAANNKNSFISWPVLYKGNKNTSKYAANLVNWAEGNMVSKLQGNANLPIKGITKANKNLLRNFAKRNKISAISNSQNYATLKRLLAMNDEGVANFAKQPMTTSQKAKIQGLLNNAGIPAILAKAAANKAAERAAVEKAIDNERAAANAARDAAMKTMANKAAANAKVAAEKAAANKAAAAKKAANNAELKAVANKTKAIEKALTELAKAKNPSAAEYSYGMIKTQLAKPGGIPFDTVKAIQDGRAAAIQMIKEYRLQQFIKEFYKNNTTAGSGTGPTWKPNEKNKNQVIKALTKAASRASLANSNRSSLQKYYNLTNDFKVTRAELKAALNKAGLTNTNRKQFIYNIGSNKFGNERNIGANARVNIYYPKFP
jgi:hypothetical protein